MRAPQSLELLAERFFPFGIVRRKKKKKKQRKKKKKQKPPKLFLPLCRSLTDSFGLQERGAAGLGGSEPGLGVARVTLKQKLSLLNQEKPLEPNQFLPRLEEKNPEREPNPERGNTKP